jgi:hypothetical protein
VCALLEVAVNEGSRGGMASCRNWSEAGHVLAKLGDEVCWIHWVGCQESVAHRGFLGARHIWVQLMMPAGYLWMPCGFQGEPGEAPLSSVGPRGTWWLPSASGGSIPPVH